MKVKGTWFRLLLAVTVPYETRKSSRSIRTLWKLPSSLVRSGDLSQFFYVVCTVRCDTTVTVQTAECSLVVMLISQNLFYIISGHDGPSSGSQL